MPTCKNCKYFERHKAKPGFGLQIGSADEYGNCHLHPPKTIQKMGGVDRLYRIVHETDWCSHLVQTKPVEQEEACDEEPTE